MRTLLSLVLLSTLVITAGCYESRLTDDPLPGGGGGGGGGGMPPVTTSDGSVGTPTPGPTPTPVPAPVPDPVPGSPADMWVEAYVDTWNRAARTLCGCVSDDDTECYDELSFSDEFSACARRMAAEFPPEQLEPSLGCSASANTRLESCLRGSMCRDDRIEGCISTFDDQMDECFRSGAAIEFFSALSECPGGPDEPFDP